MEVKGKEGAPDGGSFLTGLRTRKLLVLALLGRTGNAEVFRRGTVCVCVDVVRVPATFNPKLMGGASSSQAANHQRAVMDSSVNVFGQ